MDNNARRWLVWKSLNCTTELIMDLFQEESGWSDKELREALYQITEIKSNIAPEE